MSVIPNPHPTDPSEPPEGFHIEWVQKLDRRLAVGAELERPCRGSRGCPGAVVMALERSSGWWFYCRDHMYGSRVNEDRNVVESPRWVKDDA